jgi:hypothetical protein
MLHPLTLTYIHGTNEPWCTWLSQKILLTQMVCFKYQDGMDWLILNYVTYQRYTEVKDLF